MNNLIDNENEEINETQEVIVKRSRGRPRTKPIDLEPKEKQKPGRKGDVSKHKEYYSQYYRDHYQNNYVQCPNCWKPVAKCKLTRHMRTEICFRDQINKKYINKDIAQYIENNQEDFDNFCNYIIQNPDAFKNPKFKSVL